MALYGLSGLSGVSGLVGAAGGAVVGTPPGDLAGLTGAFPYANALEDVDGIYQITNDGTAGNLTQSTGSSKPEKTATGWKSDLLDDWMACDSVLNHISTTAHSFMLRFQGFSSPSQPVGALGVILGNQGVNPWGIWWDQGTGNLRFTGYDSGGSKLVSSALAADAGFSVVVGRHTGSLLELLIDGTWQSVACGTLTGSWTNMAFLSQQPAACQFPASGEMSDLYLWNQSHARASLESSKDWLNNEWS